ncbi:aldehyde dehydrogenase family protein, partial [Mycobacterium ulcerans]
MVSDARDKGARIYTAPAPRGSLPTNYCPGTVVSGLTTEMELYEIESFGPVFGTVSVQTEDQIFKMIQQAKYGLSSSIISRDHYRALQLARCIKAGAVHINTMTVHD